jgi:hypothetical protein
MYGLSVMVLVQFIITTANNDSYFTLPVSGKCSIRVLNASYHATEANTNSRMIQIRSDLLLFPYSPARYLTLISNSSANMNYDQGHLEYNLQNVVLQGQIRLAVVDNATGAQPATFQHCLLTLQIESMNENFNPKDQ